MNSKVVSKWAAVLAVVFFAGALVFGLAYSLPKAIEASKWTTTTCVTTNVTAVSSACTEIQAVSECGCSVSLDCDQVVAANGTGPCCRARSSCCVSRSQSGRCINYEREETGFVLQGTCWTYGAVVVAPEIDDAPSGTLTVRCGINEGCTPFVEGASERCYYDGSTFSSSKPEGGVRLFTPSIVLVIAGLGSVYVHRRHRPWLVPPIATQVETIVVH